MRKTTKLIAIGFEYSCLLYVSLFWSFIFISYFPYKYSNNNLIIFWKNKNNNNNKNTKKKKKTYYLKQQTQNGHKFLFSTVPAQHDNEAQKSNFFFFF